MFVLWYLTYFTWLSMSQYVSGFLLSNNILCMNMPQYLYPFISSQIFGLFPLSVFINVAVDISVQVFVWDMFSFLLGIYLGVELLNHVITLGLSRQLSDLKNLPANAGDRADSGSIPGSGRSPGGGNDHPTPVFLPGKSHEQRSLLGYSL